MIKGEQQVGIIGITDSRVEEKRARSKWKRLREEKRKTGMEAWWLAKGGRFTTFWGQGVGVTRSLIAKEVSGALGTRQVEGWENKTGYKRLVQVRADHLRCP
ncbi:hypothetical protein GOODEAATRI_014962 [Goodea atripinnis]|uniref:Uncharacterized protein n=1 Tax=Goodea atripinnis TaxID=208336 RepID=A0ABV0PE77_9TELE